MPEYVVEEGVFDIARSALLLDTNVLVAAFDPDDGPGRHDYALALLVEDDAPLLVPVSVIIEAWGLLVGSRKLRRSGYELLSWLTSPGRVTVLPDPFDMTRTQQLIQGLGIDCVDAVLAELATRIARLCDLNPPIPIATFDTGDFLRMRISYGLQLEVLDMRTGERTPIG